MARTIFYKPKKRKNQEQVEKRNKVILGVFISVLMAGSMFGIFASQGGDTTPSITYTNTLGEEYDFQIGQDGFYTLEIDEEELTFYFHPLDLQSFNNDTQRISSALSSPYIVTIFDVDDPDITYIDLARLELAENLARKNVYLTSAKTTNSTLYSAYPTLTCENATDNIPFLYFKKSNKTQIIQEGNCFYLEGNQYDFLRYRDLITYVLYEVIP